MGQMRKLGPCPGPCGTTYMSPHGDDDFVAFAEWHIKTRHAKDYPKGLPRAEILKMVQPA